MTRRRPRISSATRFGSTPASSAWMTTEVGGSPMYATSTCGTKPDWRTSAERPKTSPNSSSISRRMRSKFAKRSFSDGTGDRLRRLDGEDGALGRDLHRAAEAGLRLALSPEFVHLVGDVRQQDRLDASLARVLAGLARREVPAHAGSLGTRERRLDHQQVGSARDPDHVVVRRRVSAIREPPPAVGGRVDLQ